MIFCVCNNVSYDEMNNLLDRNESMNTIRFKTKVGSSCGSCLQGGADKICKEVRAFKKEGSQGPGCCNLKAMTGTDS